MRFLRGAFGTGLYVVLYGVISLGVAADDEQAGAAAAEIRPLPAVDGLNATASASTGELDEGTFYGGAGALAIPLGTRYGLQIDGFADHLEGASQDSLTIGGGAGHLFWRDPSVGLLGAYGQYVRVDDVDDGNHADLVAGAVEAALYIGRFNLEGMVGVQGGTVDAGAAGTLALDTSLFDVVRLSYFPTENLRLSIGHSYFLDENGATLGGEYGFATGAGTMAALFVDGSAFTDGDSGVLAGVRFYFGQSDKSLLRRQREDDPETLPPEINSAVIFGGEPTLWSLLAGARREFNPGQSGP